MCPPRRVLAPFCSTGTERRVRPVWSLRPSSPRLRGGVGTGRPPPPFGGGFLSCVSSFGEEMRWQSGCAEERRVSRHAVQDRTCVKWLGTIDARSFLYE